MLKSAPKFLFLLLLSSLVSAQGLKIKNTGTQTFYFNDPQKRNQATFHSSMTLLDLKGTADDISGQVSFDPSDFAKTLKGKIAVKVESINTGIELRNHHMKSANWLNAEEYPDLTFEIKSVSDLKSTADNKLSFKATGDYSMHGVTKEITADADVTYLEESEQTMKRAPGNLLGVHAKFYVKLSDYGIENQLIGNKIADNIEVEVNIVGSDKK